MSFTFETLPHHWINRLSFLIRKDLQDRFKAAGHAVTAEEWAVLLFLWQQDRRSPGRLAAMTVRDPTTMTRMLDKMERKALIKRQNDPQDRRRVTICLTDQGKALRTELVPIAQKLIAESLHGVGLQDLQAALRVMQQMAANMTKKARMQDE